MSDDLTGAGRDRFDDLKEAYVLGALDEDERREFQDYLAAHPELQAEVEELASVADLLALAPQEYEPSPELRRNLLESIGGIPGPPIAGAPPRGARLLRLFGPGGLAAAAVAAVAALVIVGLALWNVSLRGENEDLRDSLESPKRYQI
jgi:anti-sigma factor RsiW